MEKTECWREFEKWMKDQGFNVEPRDGLDEQVYFAWTGYRAAWHYLKGRDEA